MVAHLRFDRGPAHRAEPKSRPLKQVGKDGVAIRRGAKADRLEEAHAKSLRGVRLSRPCLEAPEGPSFDRRDSLGIEVGKCSSVLLSRERHDLCSAAISASSSFAWAADGAQGLPIILGF